MRRRIELYTDTRGQHRWRKKAANFVVTGASSQGFTTQASAIRNLEDDQVGTFERTSRGGPFVRGKRVVGVLNRVDGRQVVVFELEG